MTRVWGYNACVQSKGTDVVTTAEIRRKGISIFILQRFFVPKGHTAFAEAELDHTGVPANAAYHYLGHDHLGTGRFAYNQAKAQTGMVEHDPYGRRIAQSGYVPYHEFTGKPYEPRFNAYYFPYRYYNPSASRWLAPDPAGLIDGPNVYGYVLGNPLGALDFLGLKTEVCVANMGARYGYTLYHSALRIDGQVYEYGKNYGARSQPDQGRNLTCVEVKGECCDENKVLENAQKAVASSEWASDEYGRFNHNCWHFVNQILEDSGCDGPTQYNYFPWRPEIWVVPGLPIL